MNWVTNSRPSDAPTEDTSQNTHSETVFSQIGDDSTNSEWVEIPLSDEDVPPSPRGVLEFRKASESDGGCFREY